MWILSGGWRKRGSSPFFAWLGFCFCSGSGVVDVDGALCHAVGCLGRLYVGSLVGLGRNICFFALLQSCLVSYSLELLLVR